MVNANTYNLKQELARLEDALLSTDSRIEELIGTLQFKKIKPLLIGCCRTSFQLGYLLALKRKEEYTDEV